MGCAIVVIVHTLALTAPATLAALHLTLLGNAAVSFFFTLSAFLLAMPYIRQITGGGKPAPVALYAKRRFLRVFPAYVVIFLIANFVLRAVFVTNAVASERVGSSAGSGMITDPLRLLEQLTLAQNFLPGQIQTGINPAWSLATEACFYAVLPLLALAALALVRRGTSQQRAVLFMPVVLIAVGLVAKCVDALWQKQAGLSTSAAQFGPHAIAVLSRSMLVSADCFGWGIAAAFVYVWTQRQALPKWPAQRLRRVAIGVLVAAALFTAVFASSRALLAQAAFGVASGAALIILTIPARTGQVPAVSRFLDLAPGRFLGEMSLSLYLWHYPVLLLAAREGWIGAPTTMGAARSLAVVLTISVLLSWMTYRAIEVPAIRLGVPRQLRAPRPRKSPDGRLRVAIVHDYLTQRGGAERVVLEIARALPGTPVYTSLYDPAGTYPEFAHLDVRVPWFNRLPWLRGNHRLGLLFMPFAFARLRIAADVVIASSSGWAHGVRTSGRVVVYCHTPARWLYQSRRYLGGDASLLAKAALRLFRVPLRVWDKRAARRAQLYLANSTVVRERIAKVYERDALVLMPPLPDFAARLRQMPLDPSAATADWYLCVSRLMPYKNVGAIVEAFTASPQRRLIVVGDGPEGQRLAAEAAGNITFINGISDDELAALYRGCRALVAMSYEDFGLTPIEAAAAGRPSVVLRWGGYLDSMVEHLTAVFVDEPEAAAIRAGLDEVEARNWDSAAIAAHADEFAQEQFVRRLHQVISTASERSDPAPLALPNVSPVSSS